MLNVFYTVDVEVWCDGWNEIDRKFPDAFRSYVYGQTKKGQYGLTHQLGLLQDHGLRGVFFVEPLFSTRFGSAPLTEIVGLVHSAGQDVELHLHTEWVDESRVPLFEGIARKRPYLRQFSLRDQIHLIAVGARLLGEAGALPVSAFRAGSFAFNRDTLSALAANGIAVDASYNASMFGADSGVAPGTVLVEPVDFDGVREYPMTVYDDGTRNLRHVQLTSCSWSEIEGLLWQALEARRESFVVFSHNFELLNPAKNRPDLVVIDRFRRLCEFLDKNRDCFQSVGFRNAPGQSVAVQPPPLRSPLWRTCVRTAEQLYRSRFL